MTDLEIEKSPRIKANVTYAQEQEQRKTADRGFRKTGGQGFESLRWLHRIKRLGRSRNGLSYLDIQTVIHSGAAAANRINGQLQ